MATHDNGSADAAEADSGRSQRAVQSIEVGGRLLAVLTEHPTSMNLKDLAALAGLPAARAHPYLVSFAKLGLIRQDSVTGRYALGPMALQMGLSCLHQSDPIQAANPVAEALARSSGQSVAVAVWANFGPTVVRMIDGLQPLHVSMRVGSVMSIMGTATGRAFAAVMPAVQLERALGSAIGEVAPTQPRAARIPPEELDAVRRDFAAHGVTRAVGRPIPGVNAFSAPVFNHEGQPVIVMTALGHQDSLPSAWDAAIAQEVRRAAREVSRQLGHRG